MKRKELKKAIKSATPFESLYALLPEKQKEKFKQFAAGFGFSEKQIKGRLEGNTWSSLKKD